MEDLDLLEAETVGVDTMVLLSALPGVLQETGQALDKKKPEVRPAATAKPADKTAEQVGLLAKIPMPVKVGAVGVAAVLLLLRLLRR